jgi:hypothetical protein
VLLDISFKHVIFEPVQYEQQAQQQHMESIFNGEIIIDHFLDEQQRLLLQMLHDIDHEIIIRVQIL